jgi:hypothetical protein
VNPPTTLTGEDLHVVVLSPNLPFAPDPHAHAVPLVLTARLEMSPALMLHQSENPPTTLTGEDLASVVLSPKCPKELAPHAQSDLLDLIARLNPKPALVHVQSVNPPTTLTGDDEHVVELSPNLPDKLDPQLQREPLLLTAEL